MSLFFCSQDRMSFNLETNDVSIVVSVDRQAAAVIDKYVLTISGAGMTTIGPRDCQPGEHVSLYVPPGTSRTFQLDAFSGTTKIGSGTTVRDIAASGNSPVYITIVLFVPGAPRNLTTTAISSSSVEARWDTAARATSYVLYYSEGATLDTAIASISIAAPPCTVKSLKSMTLYSFAVRALGTTGGSALSQVSVATPLANTVQTPQFAPAGGTFTASQTVTITSGTASASLYYTIDGSDPTELSSAYTGPITVASTMVLKARAFKSNMAPSGINTASFVINIPGVVSAPTFDPQGGLYTSTFSVTLSSTTAGAAIRYTLDGSDPTDSSALYSGPVAITQNTTIKAKAFKQGSTPSATAAAAYEIQVALPSFSPAPGTFTQAQTVTISTATTGAEIHFTTDGSEPTLSSPAYSGAVNAASTTTFKAKAFRNNMTPSSTVSASYIISIAGTVSSPSMAPGGGVYAAAQNVSLTTATSGAEIRFTTDGTDPSDSSQLYSSPIAITMNTTLKARAFKSGMISSTTTSSAYQILVAAPAFTPPAGTYAAVQNVTLSSATPGATIRYTLDGSDPTDTSAPYTIPLYVANSISIKARAYLAGMSPSTVANANYVIAIPGTVATPSFSPGGGQYAQVQSVAISTVTTGADIRYTVDGSEPAESSALYSAAITVAQNATVKAKAFKAGMISSTTASAAYEILVAAPVFNPASGTFTSPQNVTMTTATTGAVIHFTTDGSEPTEASPAYSVAVNVANSNTLKAKAFKSGMTPSATVNATYTINIPGTVATPTFSPGGGSYGIPQTVTISTTTIGADIRYTIDGSDPTDSSVLYSAPVLVSQNTTLKAKALRASMISSTIASAAYQISVALPVFNPPAGTYTGTQNVAITSATGGAVLYYTTDGSDPTAASTRYTAAVAVAAGMTLKAIALKSGMTTSAIASSTYIINIPGTVATPTFGTPAGTYSNNLLVGLYCTTAGSSIRYTIDGSEPTDTSLLFTGAGISVAKSLTLKAKAFAGGMYPSITATAAYVFVTPNPQFSPPAGGYATPQTVSISIPGHTGEIRYTTNGIDPTASSSLYSTPINTGNGITIKAIGFLTGWNQSPIATGVFTIVAPPVPARITATVISSNFVRVFWAKSQNAARYKLLKSTTASGTYDSIAGTTDTAITLSGLTKGGTFFFKVTAINLMESAPSVYTQATVPQTWYGMKSIPTGSFLMGDTLSANNQPVRNVTVSAFYMDATELTRGKYAAVSGTPANPADSAYPVEWLSWYAAAYLCNMRSKFEGLDTVYSYTGQTGTFTVATPSDLVLTNLVADFSKNGFRLPTEAEWEYACRAGTSTTFYWGTQDPGIFAWYFGNSSGTEAFPVAQKAPNTFGLYDMSGNVAEWCNDWYVEPYMATDQPTDPKGPATGTDKVYRGGTFKDITDGITSTVRFRDRLTGWGWYTGVRMVLPNR
jgi:formylglycine-generating enzyme required for sulfatase activity